MIIIKDKSSISNIKIVKPKLNGEYTGHKYSDALDISKGLNIQNSTFTTEQFESLNTYNWDKITNMGSMFKGCYSLTSIPQIDTSNVTNMSSMFNECKSLTSIPQIDTSNVTDMNYMFIYCSSLTTIPLLDTSNVTNMSSMFKGCYSLTDLGGFLNLSVNLDLSYASNLTVDSLMNVINNLKDMTGATAPTLTLGSTNLVKLTDEQIAVGTNKNWIING